MKRSVNEYDEGRGGGLRKAAEIGAIAAGGAGIMAGPIKVASLTGEKELERRGAKKREADAEMKRESRGVPKPANFDAIEEAKQEVKDAADRKKISDMGYAKGGSASSRADGIAQRGKTRGKMC
jgi:imidazolonepropionase-like amidohydrolase